MKRPFSVIGQSLGNGKEKKLHRSTRLPKLHQESKCKLPIFNYKEKISSALKASKTLVLVGETGSGKSTQIPQYLYESGFAIKSNKESENSTASVICCTQPRRVAAITVAQRVAEEIGTELGNICGYVVRFDDKTSPNTRIKYITDGVLLREAMEDPLLSKYSVLVLDEAHERSLQTDILFGLVRKLQDARPDDLRVIVMSATLDVEPFLNFFKDAALLEIPGRTYPVQVHYTVETQQDYIDAALSTCLQIHEDEPSGDILVFLPGREDIEGLAGMLQKSFKQLKQTEPKNGKNPVSYKQNGHSPNVELMDALIVKVFAALPQDQQLEAFAQAPKNTRKFILATNIAETSVTISGVKHVIDCGLVKQRSFIAGTGMEALKVVPISKSQAQQRAGRAGREGAGTCYRLFTEAKYLSLNHSTTPEIERVDLCQVVLQLKVIGIDKIQDFHFLSPPPSSALRSALETLCLLGALNSKGDLTKHGRKIAALPLSPIFSHLVVTSAKSEFSCTSEVLAAVSCLSADNIFYVPSDQNERSQAKKMHGMFSSSDGDLSCLSDVFAAYKAARNQEGVSAWCRQRYLNSRSLDHASKIRDQLSNILKSHLNIDPETSCGAERTRLLQCIAAGLSLQVAIRQPAVSTNSSTNGNAGRCYRIIRGGQEVYMHPSSCIFYRNPPPKCLVYTEVLDTSKQYIKWVTVVDPSWLAEFAPDMFRKQLKM